MAAAFLAWGPLLEFAREYLVSGGAGLSQNAHHTLGVSALGTRSALAISLDIDDHEAVGLSIEARREIGHTARSVGPRDAEQELEK
jgi:hypothetical protein